MLVFGIPRLVPGTRSIEHGQMFLSAACLVKACRRNGKLSTGAANVTRVTLLQVCVGGNF
jgi:hypothetical protein